MKARRLSMVISVLCMLALASSCALLGKGGESGDVVVKGVARSLAYGVAEKNPDVIAPGVKMIEGMVQVQNDATVVPLLANAVDYLGQKVDGDPLLMANLKDLLGLLNIDRSMPLILDDTQFALMQVALAGFMEGLQLAGGME